MRRLSNTWIVGGLIATACLAYWASTLNRNSPGHRVEAIRQRFHASGASVSSGHSSLPFSNAPQATSIDRQLANLEPGTAGWDSEVASTAIGQQLKRLSELLESDKVRTVDEFSPIVAANFQGEILPPNALEEVLDDGVYRIERLPVGEVVYPHTASFNELLDSLLGTNELGKRRCSFKVVHIQPNDQSITTQVLIESVAHTETRVVQTNITSSCQWQMGADEPKLQSMQVLDYERVSFVAEGRTLFDDVTASLFTGLPEADTWAFNEQVLRGVGHWSERLSGIDDMSIYGHHGIAVGDVNGDGLEDIYVCDSGGLPNRLYVQQADGTLRDKSRESQTDWLEATTSGLLIDLDNDSDADLVVATVAGVVVASNNGAGVFRIRAAIPNFPEAQSLSAADYDNDGDLDIYVTVYGRGGEVEGERGSEAAPPIPYHDANNGGRNVLLQNQGSFQFVDVTDDCGLDTNNQRFSFAASWEDFDLDGDLDLYVANDFGRNNFYRNDDGMFRDVAAELGVEDMAGGMSVSWGDCNQDGLMDIYVGNMFSAAGNRVTYQRRFLDERTPDSASGIQRMARGNTLFQATANGTFADVSQTAGVMMGRWAWSSQFVDLNNDSRQDLVVANGYFTNTEPDDL